MLNSKIYKYIDNKAGVRATVVNATEAVREMQQIQATYPIATMMVGRSMVAASLMAAQLKQKEMVSLYFRGDGPIEMVFAEGNYEGGVRGYTTQPQLELGLKDNQLDLGGAIGRGTLSVVRTFNDGEAPYRGTVEIQTGEVGDDVAFYLQQSQQVKAIVSLGVKVNTYGQVVSAGGVIVELLPGANDAVEIILAERVHEAGSLSELIAAGGGAREMLNLYLDGFQMTELEHPHQLSYTCRCSVDRLRRSVELLPLEDIDDIIAKKKAIDAKCEFCGRQYQISADEAKDLRAKKYKNTLN